MKKIKVITLFVILAVSLFGLVKETSALSFGGFSSPQLPEILYSGSVWANFDGYSTFQNNTVYNFADSGHQEYEFFGCIGYTGGSSTGVLITQGFHQVNQISTPELFSSSFLGSYFSMDYLSGSTTILGIYQHIIDGTTNIYPKFLVSAVPRFPNSPGLASNIGVICIETQYYYNLNQTGTKGMYLYGGAVSFYNDFDGLSYYDSAIYTQSTPYGKLIKETPSLISTFMDQDGYGYLSGSVGILKYFYQGNASTNGTYIAEFMHTVSGSQLDFNLPFWFSSSGETLSDTGGIAIPGTSTGTNFYSSCAGFTDVGCYIKGSVSSLAYEFKTAFSSIFTWLFPDISFNGMSETCINNVNSGSLSSTTSLPFLQKISNLFVILVPVAPANNSQVCTFEGVKTIVYHQDNASVLDILFVMFAFVPLLFSLKPHHD